MAKSNKNKWDPNDSKNHTVRGVGPGCALNFPGWAAEDSQSTKLSPEEERLLSEDEKKALLAQRAQRPLAEDSPLEAGVGGHARTDKLLSPDTRELVLHSRRTEIDAFANDRGLNPTIVYGIAEAAMRMGKVPNLTQYGIVGDEAKAIKHFVAGEILNIAIEDEPAPEGKSVAETTSANVGAGMRLGTGFFARPGLMVDHDALDKTIKERENSVPALTLGTGVTDKPALTMADISRLANEDAAQLLAAAEAGVKPEVQPVAEGQPETQTEGEKIAKPKGEKIGKALKGLGGKLRSPAEVAPGQFNSANGGSGPLPQFDITVKEDEHLAAVKSLVSLTESELEEGLRSRLADFKADYKETHAGELGAGAKPGLRTKLGAAAYAARRTVKGQNKGFGGGMKEDEAPSASVLRESRVGAAVLREDGGPEPDADDEGGAPDEDSDDAGKGGKLAFLKKFAKK